MRLAHLFCSCAAVVVLVITPQLAQAQTVVGLGVKGFFEDSKLNGEEQIAVLQADESYEYRSDGFLSGSIWFLLQLSERIRVGSAVDYYGTYASMTRCDRENRDDCSDFEPNRYEFGKLLEFYGRFEYHVPVSDDLDLLLGTVFGLPVLFPSGDFREEIDGLKEEGANVLSLPRIGYLLGPNIGARWKYNDHLAIRGDFIVKWEQMFLFRTRQNIGSDPPIAFRKKWTTGTLRYELGLGVEVSL